MGLYDVLSHKGTFWIYSFPPCDSNQHLWKDVCKIVNVGLVSVRELVLVISKALVPD